MHHRMSPAKASTLKTSNSTAAAAKKPQPTDPSTVNINAGQQLLQGLQLLIGLLNRAVCLHIAGDVVADVVHQGDGVSLMSLLQRRSVLFDDLGKLGLLHQLWQTGTTGTQVWIYPEGELSVPERNTQIIYLM